MTFSYEIDSKLYRFYCTSQYVNQLTEDKELEAAAKALNLLSIRYNIYANSQSRVAHPSAILGTETANLKYRGYDIIRSN